jgi:hypothetical protein
MLVSSPKAACFVGNMPDIITILAERSSKGYIPLIGVAEGVEILRISKLITLGL